MSPSFTSTVHAINFGALSGKEFERLVFAYLYRRWPWSEIGWTGQGGADAGRDIEGLREHDSGNDELVVAACANWRAMSFDKAQRDIKKIIGRGARLPDELLVSIGSSVSMDLKARIAAEARAHGIARCRVVAGTEFEEDLRLHAGSLLRRFFAGEALPDDPLELRAACIEVPRESEREALQQLVRAFERPAFTTPLGRESSLPAFRRAISDTIETINTGIWRTRDGIVIRRLPARFDFRVPIQSQLGEVVAALETLRASFDDGLRSKTIRPCACNKPDCPVFMIDPSCVEVLEHDRERAVSLAHTIIRGLREM